MATIEERKKLAAQQYALDKCQEHDMSQLGKIQEAWENGFETANEKFQFTLKDMEMCFEMSRKKDFYIDFDDEQYQTIKYKSFNEYLKTIKK